MNSKRIFSWSKRQSASDTYYRTGGLLPIDTGLKTSGNGVDTKNAPVAGQKPQSQLTIALPDSKQIIMSPVSSPYRSTLTNAASNLQSAFNDMLRSPAPGLTACTRPGSIHKPLPGRPRSFSLPSSPGLPAELPGSILQENQGFPLCVTVDDSAVRPVSQSVRRTSQPPDKCIEKEGDFLDILDLFPLPFSHSGTVVAPGHEQGEMKSVRTGKALNAQSNTVKVQLRQSLNDAGLQRASSPNPVASPSSTATCSASTIEESSSISAKARIGVGKLLQPSLLNTKDQGWNSSTEKRESHRSEIETLSTPISATTHNKQVEELKATISAQDQTISSLQVQFSSLRASHEAHVESLVEAHSAEVASLKNHARVLEEQLAHRPSLHHASSNNLLFYLDTTEPHTPGRESSQQPNDTGSASSTKSFHITLEKQLSPSRQRDSPEMESLKRKLSSTRRPETGNRNLLPELNQYKQNNVALQKQIESLMAKLNESKKNERTLKTSLEEAERKRDEWQAQAKEADNLAKSAQALQNTVDHLENRLELANIGRLDAEEQLCNLQAEKSPFEMKLDKLQIPSGLNLGDTKATQNAHLSMSTVFSSGSPISPDNEPQDLATLATFVSHIERLQDQSRQKDARIIELETISEELKQSYAQLEREQNTSNLQMDIQNELLKKTRRTDLHIEQLRTAIMDREAIIEEKENEIRAIKRQLDHHKLLLQAEIRKHASISLHANIEADPLPALDTLAAKADIDKWIARLKDRLRKESMATSVRQQPISNEVHLEGLRQEIDFYIREIIFYKLDIRGYKSDIKKLKRITDQLSAYGSRASDIDSETSSVRPAVTPRPRFDSATPELGRLDTSFGTTTSAPRSRLAGLPITPPLSSSANTPGFQRSDGMKMLDTPPPPPKDLERPKTPQIVPDKVGLTITNETNDIGHGISPRSVALLSPERRKPTPPSPDRGKLGDLLTNFPLNTPASPHRHSTRRRMSESTVASYATVNISVEPTGLLEEVSKLGVNEAIQGRERSASLPDSSVGKAMPDRPPRPRYGLFELPRLRRTATPGPSNPPRTDVLAEALKRSLNEQTKALRPSLSRNNSNTSSVQHAPPVPGKDDGDVPIKPPSPMAPVMLRPRASSTGSRTSNNPISTASPPERKLSSASASSIPFVIGMGSPHNPALITPSSNMLPTSCSITRNAPHKIVPPTSRIGVGGTMASFTPVTSPTSPTDTSRPEPLSNITAAKPTRMFSLSRKQDEQAPRPPRTPSHSRNVSGSSIRTAIRLPKSKDKEDLIHKMRKDSISTPQPLGSPFGYERSMHANGGGRKEDEFEPTVGEAI